MIKCKCHNSTKPTKSFINQLAKTLGFFSAVYVSVCVLHSFSPKKNKKKIECDKHISNAKGLLLRKSDEFIEIN